MVIRNFLKIALILPYRITRWWEMSDFERLRKLIDASAALCLKKFEDLGYPAPEDARPYLVSCIERYSWDTEYSRWSLTRLVVRKPKDPNIAAVLRRMESSNMFYINCVNGLRSIMAKYSAHGTMSGWEEFQRTLLAIAWARETLDLVEKKGSRP